MNWKTFFAMMARDAHVARRNIIPSLLQTMLQPMLFVFVFGRVMTGSGLMPATYKSMLLPGIIAIAMAMTGIWSVAMPLIAEFQFTREIEDRLLAPMDIGWLAVEKIVAGMLQAVIAGIIVFPAAWLLMGREVNMHFASPVTFICIALLVALFSSAAGLTLGCSVGQTQVGLMFSMVVAPMIFFGCVYYPWSALQNFPIMQKLVLINPLVYASEGLRGVLVPQVPHLPVGVTAVVLLLMDAGLIAAGLYRFHRKAVT